jgi:CO/xanthine dehydrogenase Mo-binding subunit
VDGYDLAEGSGGAVASLPTGAEQVLAQLVAEPLQRPVSRVGRFHVGDI